MLKHTGSFSLVLVMATLVFSSGCLSRSLTIKSDPPGATVYFQDEKKGETPVTFDPVFYGSYRVRIEKEGYHRVEDKRLLKAPPYLWVPLDLVVELLPFKIHDDHEWAYALDKAEAIPTPVPPQYSK